MAILRIGKHYAAGLRIVALPVQVQDSLRDVFARLHEPYLKQRATLLMLYTVVEGEHRLYLLVAAESIEALAEAYTLLEDALCKVPGVRYVQLGEIDLEIVLDVLKSMPYRYCIVGPTARLLDYCSNVLVLLRPIGRTDLMNRMSMLEHALKTTVCIHPHAASTRSIELTSRDHALVKVQHELSRLRKGLSEGTWIGIVLTDTVPQVETHEGDSVLEPQGGLIKVLHVNGKVLDRVRKLDLPTDLSADPDVLYIPSPRYLAYLTSSDVADLLRCTVDKPGLAVNVVLPPRLSSQAREGELYLGKVLDANLRPVADMYISLRDFCHVGVFGTTGSGKTVTAQRIAAEFVRCGGRVIVLDWKFEWRRLLRIGKAAFYEVGYGVKHPLRWNPLRPPPGMDWRHWFSKVVTWFATCYGLGPVQVNILRSHLWDLYLAKLERGEYPTMRDLYEEVKRGLENVKGRSDIRDAYHRLLFRLWTYGEGPLSKVFDKDYDTTITDLLQDYDVVDIECAAVDDVDKPFIVGLIAFQLYYTCSVNRRPLTVPTLLVVEEAHRVVKSVPAVKGESDIVLEDIWGEITAMARAYNLYLMFIIQTLKPLSPLVLSNIRILVVHALQLPEDIEYVAKLLSGTDQVENIAKFIPYLPVGYAIIKVVSGKAEEPRLVVEPVSLRDVSDQELEALLAR